MIGVVLWSDLEDQKAVFWCEDHGDLAYYDASTDEVPFDGLLNAGDMVEFEIRVESKVRRAQNPCVIRPKVCNGLQDHLRATAAKAEATVSPVPTTGQVLTFAPKPANDFPQRRARNG